MTEGWHCLHLYYRVDQSELNRLDEAGRGRVEEELSRLLDPEREGGADRMQPARRRTQGRPGPAHHGRRPAQDQFRAASALGSSPLGPALVPVYSFVSITEVSEYVPTVEQYGERLKHDGTSESDPAYQAKINAYAQRLPMMNKQRLYPDLPPLACHLLLPDEQNRQVRRRTGTRPRSASAAP